MTTLCAIRVTGVATDTQQSDSDDDVKITGVQELSNYVFNPLTIQQRRIICERISLQMQKGKSQPL